MHTLASIADRTNDRYDREHRPPFSATLLSLHKPPQNSAMHVPRRLEKLLDQETYDQSICHVHIADVMTADAAAAWYKKVKDMAKDATTNDVYSFNPATLGVSASPRAEKPSVMRYIEVIWDNKNFDYARKGLERNFASLKDRFASKRYWYATSAVHSVLCLSGDVLATPWR